MPPLSALRAFEAAARHRSLSAAARELNVTHPAIAQQVRRLESWFDTPLLIRAGRGVEPTEAGMRLATGLSEGFATIHRTIEAMVADDAPLHVTLTPTFAVSWLMPRLGGFREAHPDISLTLDPTTDTVDFKRGTHDLGIRFGKGDWPDLDVERLLPSDLVVAAAPSLLAGHVVEKPADLLTLPWIQDLGTDELRVWMAGQGVEDARPRSVDQMPGHMMLDAIRRGQGIGITGRAWLADDIATGRVVTLFDREQSPDLGYWIASRPGVKRASVKAFVKWLKAESENHIEK